MTTSWQGMQKGERPLSAVRAPEKPAKRFHIHTWIFPGRAQRRGWVWVILFLQLLAGGCAYYNTFYNADKEFKAAEKERGNRRDDKPTAAENKSYNTAIEKASKVLELYPASKYVDDALLMLGKCFYYKGEHAKAERKFEELLSLYGDGELADEALLWRAKSRSALNNFDAAISDCATLLTTVDDHALLQDAQFQMGEIHFVREDYRLALDEYEKLVRIAKDKELKWQAYTRLGECQFKLKNYGAAAQAHRNASKQSAVLRNRYSSLLDMAEALKMQENHDEAIKILNRLLSEEAAKEYWPDVEYQIAESMYMQDDIDGAMKWYKSITEDYQKSKAAALSYFQLGHIYETRRFDYAAAKENYDKVKTASPQSEVIPPATTKSTDLAKLLQLQSTIAAIKTSLAAGVPDSLRPARSDSSLLAAKAVEVEALQAPAPQKGVGAVTSQKLPSIPATESGLSSAHLQIAELFYFQFSAPDSALSHYRAAHELSPEGEVGAQSLYSLAYILESATGDSSRADSLLAVLIEKYPDSPQADGARHALGLTPRLRSEDSIIERFCRAEEALWQDGNYPRAMQLFKSIGDDSTNGDLAAKALFSRGWILEHRLFDNDGAYDAYKYLATLYPKSTYTQKIKSKLAVYERMMQASQDSAAATDTTASDTLLHKVQEPDTTALLSAPAPASRTARRGGDDEAAAQGSSGQQNTKVTKKKEKL